MSGDKILLYLFVCLRLSLALVYLAIFGLYIVEYGFPTLPLGVWISYVLLGHLSS